MRLTRRGKVVFTIITLLAIWGLWEVSAYLWWTDHGYCWGTMTECVGL